MGLEIGDLEKETGRQLTAFELTPKTVVVIIPPPYKHGMTFWVTEVDTMNGVVAFYSGERQWAVINTFDAEGKIFDDKGREIKVYEYLGEI